MSSCALYLLTGVTIYLYEDNVHSSQMKECCKNIEVGRIEGLFRGRLIYIYSLLIALKRRPFKNLANVMYQYNVHTTGVQSQRPICSWARDNRKCLNANQILKAALKQSCYFQNDKKLSNMPKAVSSNCRKMHFY